MKCPHCQGENREGADFCGDCGKSLFVEIPCAKCGNINPSNKKFCDKCGQHLIAALVLPSAPTVLSVQPQPTSFANGRYQVKKFLGEGGKKKVYLAHDTLLDRDVAFALIKTEKLDETSLTRIKREAQAMGKLGDHPNIVSIYDLGDHQRQPYIVLPLMSGGDVEGLIKKAPDHKLPLEQALNIARAVCQGLVFAHAKGIIHRDIKPGNVWLSADGTAKIGDFGLAVAIDLSRLTQQGMMVGTVSYMPPEQAMGGEVTAKADLYSLGAMLYEMVTGRPPFVGDDSIAIIGQHINTPPVSPTWHRADLPPALETLILQLLEKDPGKRPESASLVLQALDSIDSGKVKPVSVKETTASPENPLYRRVFVGREPELKQLQSAFDGAMSGQGALMMVLGEPGIGKTALCEQLATYVTLRGGRTLVGHCYEEGSLSLPYLAFVEALRSYVLSREVKDLREELGTGAGDVARIVSEIRERLKIKPRPQKDPEEERYRLMQAVTSFLTHAACVQPLLIILEDLHDADKGTLDMLTHVSRNLTNARLLIVGTYRDVEVDRTHPLSAALAELRRISTFGRVILRGLNADEVRRMLESIAAQEVPWGLAEAVHRQTEGNPLFVQEVIRYLNEEGLIKREGGQWKGKSGTPLEMNIPEGLRDVIGKRLSLLSKECNQLLSVASVIGREFALETLKVVSGMNENVFVSTLKQAIQLSILEERSQVGVIRYRFTHAFFRQTLYEELIAPQRLKLHQQVARALEKQYGQRLQEHAAELAEHFSQSTDPADLSKSVKYGEMAAKRAAEVYAYGEAVRLLDQTLKVQEILDPEDETGRCDILLDLCDALLNVPDTRRIIETEAPEAFSLAERLGDGTRAAQACIWMLWAIIYEKGPPGWTSPQYAEWAGRADRCARPNTAERAWADILLGSMKLLQGDRLEARRLLTPALDLARKLDEKNAIGMAAATLLGALQAPQHTAERRQLAEELWASFQSGLKVTRVSATSLWGVFALGFNAFLQNGQRHRAEEAARELRASAQVSASVSLVMQSASTEAVLATMDGRLEEAVSIAESIRARGEEAGILGLARVYEALARFRACIYLGTVLDALERELRAELPEGVLQSEIQYCLVLAHLGKKKEVSETLEKHVVRRPGIGTAEDETPAWQDNVLLEAAVLISHHEAAELLLKRLGSAGISTTGFHFNSCISRHLGGAAALLGRYDEARQHYQQAIKVCTEMRFRTELALTRLQLAELLLEHYSEEKKEAIEHLDFAIQEFREMKMQPSLERALRQKKILKA